MDNNTKQVYKLDAACAALDTDSRSLTLRAGVEFFALPVDDCLGWVEPMRYFGKTPVRTTGGRLYHIDSVVFERLTGLSGDR